MLLRKAGEEMILAQAQVDRILAGKTVQVRKLVKEGEWANGWSDWNTFDGNVQRIESVDTKKLRHKWQVGQDYSVQEKGKKHGCKACPKCGWRPTKDLIIPFPLFNLILEGKTAVPCVKCLIEIQPLRFEITSIHKERLLDITEEDAKKEGFKDRISFLGNFCVLANRSVEFKQDWITTSEGMRFAGRRTIDLKGWNPAVWVLEVVKK